MTGAALTLPPDRFYWAVLDASSLHGASPLGLGRAARAQRLGYLFEAVLPVPIEEVQAAYTPLRDPGPPGRVLACAMPSETLRGLITADAPVSLSPAALPAFVPADAADPSTLNLLVDDFEPAPLRSARARRALTAAGLVLACAAAVTIGLERRTAAARADLAATATAEQGLYQRILPPGPASQHPALRLAAELRRLRGTRSSGDDDRAAPPPADESLASLLARWPEGSPAATESVSAGPDALTLVATLPDGAAAERFGAAFGDIPQWRRAQPQITGNASPAGQDDSAAAVRVALSYRRAVQAP